MHNRRTHHSQPPSFSHSTYLSTVTERYTEATERFIAASAAAGHPFFVYLPHTFPHVPLAASADFDGRSEAGLYGDVVEELDASVGRIVDALDAAGVTDNTLLIFTSGTVHQRVACVVPPRKGGDETAFIPAMLPLTPAFCLPPCDSAIRQRAVV